MPYRPGMYSGGAATEAPPQEGASGSYRPGMYSGAMGSALQGSAAPRPQEAEAAKPGFASKMGDLGVDTVERAGMGALGAIPLASATKEWIHGGDPYGGQNGGYRALNDASQALLTGATAGKGLGAGVALGAGMNALHIPEAADWVSKKFEDSMDAETPSVGWNAFLNTPAALASTAAQIIPSVLAGKLTGHGTTPEQLGPKAFDPVTAGRDALLKYGGEPSVSSQINMPVVKGLAAMTERGSKIGPLTRGSYEAQDIKNSSAIENLFKDKFGNDILEPSSKSNGEALKGILDQRIKERHAQLKPVIEALESKGELKGLGTYIAEQVQDSLKSNNLDPEVEGRWHGLIQAIANEDNPLKIKKILTGARYKFEQPYVTSAGVKVPTGLNVDWDTVNNSAKTALYNGLNAVTADSKGLNGLAPRLGDVLEKADYDYARNSEAINPLQQVLAGKLSAEKFPGAMLQAGTGPIQDFMSGLNPRQVTEFQRVMARELIEKSKNANGNIDPKPMSHILNKQFKSVIPVIFGSGDGPSILRDLKTGHEAMKVANINELQTFNPSGSGKTMLEQTTHSPLAQLGAIGGLAHAGHPGLALGAAAVPIGEAAYTFGVRPAFGLARKFGVTKAPSHEMTNLGKLGRLVGQNQQNERLNK